MPASLGVVAVGATSRAQIERLGRCGLGLRGLLQQAIEEQPP